jgi:hypothetical protein
MVKAGEVVAKVRVEHPIHLPPRDPGGERIQRVMRAAPRPESGGEAESRESTEMSDSSGARWRATSCQLETDSTKLWV